MNTDNKILFYEWSDIKNTPIRFQNNEDFINFCNKSNIKLSKNNLNFINNNDFVYSICKKGKNELILSKDRRNLMKNISKNNRRSIIQ